MLVIELLHRIMDVIKDYFGGVSEGVIKEQYVIVYEVRVVGTAVIVSSCLANKARTMNLCTLTLENMRNYLPIQSVIKPQICIKFCIWKCPHKHLSNTAEVEGK